MQYILTCSHTSTVYHTPRPKFVGCCHCTQAMPNLSIDIFQVGLISLYFMICPQEISVRFPS